MTSLRNLLRWTIAGVGFASGVVAIVTFALSLLIQQSPTTIYQTFYAAAEIAVELTAESRLADLDVDAFNLLLDSELRARGLR
jgi:hypothetical protein